METTTTLHQPTADQIMDIPCGGKFVSTSGCLLTVNQRTYPKDASLEDVQRGISAIEVIATSDGRGYIAQWHEGTCDIVDVRVERYSERGLEFHGFIDPTSRRITQAG